MANRSHKRVKKPGASRSVPSNPWTNRGQGREHGRAIVNGVWWRKNAWWIRRPVAGWTIARHSAHRDHIRETLTQNARSIGRSRGRGVAAKNCKLLAQHQVLGDQDPPRTQRCEQCADDGLKDRFHTGDHRPVHPRRHRRIGTLVRVRSPRAYFVDSPRNRVESEFLASTTVATVNALDVPIREALWARSSRCHASVGYTSVL